MTDWYANRHDLEPGQTFTTHYGGDVELDRRVPGDGTRWYVLDIDSDGRRFSYDSQIEPSDLKERIQ
jgi:hypothetical protein